MQSCCTTQGRVKVGRGRGPSLSVPQSFSRAKAPPLSLFSLQISRSPGAMALDYNAVRVITGYEGMKYLRR